MAQVRSLCERLSVRLKAGDCVLMNGPLGSGKTQIVKFIATALGSNESVTSPTYGLANFYSSDSMPILHIDTYRLSSIDEFRQLGLDEYFDTHLTLIEWGDQVKVDFEDFLEIRIDFVDDAPDAGQQNDRRTIMFEWSGSRWGALVDLLLAQNENISAEGQSAGNRS